MAAPASLRLGTRGSALARWQADWVSGELSRLGHTVTLVPIVTAGDREQGQPIQTLPGIGAFTKEIQRALLDGRIDLAVHSLKDLPTETVAGLALAAVPERESVADVLLSRDGQILDMLPAGARVGTGSLRRRTQLLHLRPDLSMHDIRGNVDTRLRKLDEGEFDAIILAEAGLKRLGLANRITQVLAQSKMLPAVGQGALAIETRADDVAAQAAVAPLEHPACRAAVVAERSLLAALDGGCLAPVGAWGRLNNAGQLLLDAVVLSADGTRRLFAAGQDNASAAFQLGQRVADDLLRQGAGELIRQARETAGPTGGPR
ncbi:MAG: hydroxymethylbilane synthase [Planctomycetia bacterium]|nr:hydroxymethylbilane synthase [Planctomycetia bacterium]